MLNIINLVLCCLGVACVTIGTALIYLPAAWIVFGAILMLMTLTDWKREPTDTTG